MKKEELDAINQMMEVVIEDNSVPKNIRRTVNEAKEKINSDENEEVTLTSALYLLDEALNDINMPFHTRTELMSIISELERLKEKLK